jgi:hypothetical protein
MSNQGNSEGSNGGSNGGGSSSNGGTKDITVYLPTPAARSGVPPAAHPQARFRSSPDDYYLDAQGRFRRRSSNIEPSAQGEQAEKSTSASGGGAVAPFGEDRQQASEDAGPEDPTAGTRPVVRKGREGAAKYVTPATEHCIVREENLESMEADELQMVNGGSGEPFSPVSLRVECSPAGPRRSSSSEEHRAKTSAEILSQPSYPQSAGSCLPKKDPRRRSFHQRFTKPWRQVQCPDKD